jgi:uncharacterized membrane protein YbhN (UPF0104 family)
MARGVDSEPTPPADGDDDPPVTQRPPLLTRLLQARDTPRSPWLMIVAIALFVVFTIVAFAHLPRIDKPVRWELILAAGLLIVPIITVLNALEYRLMAHFAAHHPPLLEIVQVTILGSAANLLPVPGAVVVRLANLRKAGVRVTHGLNLTAIIGLTWVGAACALGSLSEMWSHPNFALVAGGFGVGFLTIALVMLSRVLDHGSRIAGSIQLLGIEAAFVVLQAFRLLLIAAALRFDVSFAQSTALVIAAVSAAAIGFLPAGLGAREAIAAALAPIVGVPAAVGLVITAIDRIVNLVVLAAFAGLVTVATRRERVQAQTDPRPGRTPG